MAKAKAQPIKIRAADDDDADSLDPYSDELDVSSPELLETGEGGHVLREEGEDDWEDEVSPFGNYEAYLQTLVLIGLGFGRRIRIQMMTMRRKTTTKKMMRKMMT
jgi:hypothetical protein